MGSPRKGNKKSSKKSIGVLEIINVAASIATIIKFLIDIFKD